ncbi:nucleolus protein [Rhodotorula toruloides]|uniref:25S rRNA adenine-N(1) methyltransferase n=1 Tax=Rhodotorula toruloides TaxID=5286 RepID=A0A511KB23_RHOTO|nr:nucleolus protein [Rhodotorula toruloides]
MPHTNSQYAKDRKVSRPGKKPAFLNKAKPKKLKSSTTASLSSAKSDVVDSAPVDPTIPANRQEQTALIRAFHAIEKKLASPGLTSPEERKKLLDERERLGGLKTYQDASVHGGDKSRGGESSKWLVKQIRDLKIGLDVNKEKEVKKVEPTILEDGTKVWPKIERRKLRLLDVGAIAGTAYAGYPWISTTSIDLNPHASHVLKYNFFDFPIPHNDEEKYDIVALSLVINFEGSLVNRGHMLVHAHNYLLPNGYLYIVLPLPCLTNSRYLSHDRFSSILNSTGWDVVRKHDSAKLTYWLVTRKEGEGAKGDGKVWKREEVRSGVGRNNFVIVIKPGTEAERGVANAEEVYAKAAEKEE